MGLRSEHQEYGYSVAFIAFRAAKMTRMLLNLDRLQLLTPARRHASFVVYCYSHGQTQHAKAAAALDTSCAGEYSHSVGSV